MSWERTRGLRVNSLLPKAGDSPWIMQAEAGSPPLHTLLKFRNQRPPQPPDMGLASSSRQVVVFTALERAQHHAAIPGVLLPWKQSTMAQLLPQRNPHRWLLFHAPPKIARSYPQGSRLAKTENAIHYELGLESLTPLFTLGHLYGTKMKC